MTVGNFNWFLHTMLFYHTQFVLERQMQKARDNAGNDEDSSDGDDEDSSDNEE